MELCILVVTTYTKKLGLHFGKELPTVREFGNFIRRSLAMLWP